jgi:hypothetical protein
VEAGAAEMSLHRRSLRDSIFKADITLLVGSIDELRREFDRKADTTGALADSNAKVIEYTHSNGVIEWYVWFPRWDPKSPYNVDTLVHEMVHLASQILRHRGVVMCRESEETYAYYQEALFRMVRGQLDAWARKPKTKPKKKRR